MSATLRCFIAIELENNIQDRLSELQSELRKSGADVKWVKKENIHLTLKFLGEIKQDSINKLKEALDEICIHHKNFIIALGGVGAFPKLVFPRILWVGIISGEGKIVDIAKDLENSLEKINFKKETRPFSAHITIGRNRSNLNRIHLIEQLRKNKNWGNFPMAVNKITLLKSTLTSTGPIYEPIYIKTLSTN